jgi:broad specificity phosphatase PhoE
MRFFFLFIVVACMSCSHTYYVVRHAEKATATGNMMSNDVPLTEQGQKRAEQVKELLKNKRIKAVYSTNTIRTKSTGQPTADHFGLSVNIYGPVPDTGFIRMLKASKKNILVVGHSNTVDDIANGLCGEKKVAGDLDEAEYNKLYIIKARRGKTYFTEKTIFP